MEVPKNESQWVRQKETCDTCGKTHTINLCTTSYFRVGYDDYDSLWSYTCLHCVIKSKVMRPIYRLKHKVALYRTRREVLKAVYPKMKKRNQDRTKAEAKKIVWEVIKTPSKKYL